MVKESASLQQNGRKMVQKRREARARVDSCELLLKLSPLTILCECSAKIVMGATKFVIINFKEQNIASKKSIH